MSHTVYCLILKRKAEGLDRPPYPGPLGERIYANISRQGWQQWLQRLATIMNENRLSTADPKTIRVIEKHMQGFLFGEGEMGGLPPGFTPPGRAK